MRDNFPRRGFARWLASLCVAILVLAGCRPGETRGTNPGAGAPAMTEGLAGSPARPTLTMPTDEYIEEMHRTASGGWVLTGQRLLLDDDASWAVCWDQGPGYHGVVRADVRGDRIRIVEGNAIFLSNDGCRTWETWSLPIEPTGLSFPTPDIGYVVGLDGMNAEATFPLARVFRSDDGGRHWRPVSDRIEPTHAGGRGASFWGPLSVAYADVDRGLMADGVAVWATIDGGTTWSVVPLPVPSVDGVRPWTLTDPVVSGDGSAAIAAGTETEGPLAFYRTSRIGAAWELASVLPGAGPHRLLLDLRSTTGWMLAGDRSVQATDDAGKTWGTTAIAAAPAYWPGRISFADRLHGWTVVQEPEAICPMPSVMPGYTGRDSCDRSPGPMHLAATDDGGATWHDVFR